LVLGGLGLGLVTRLITTKESIEAGSPTTNIASILLLSEVILEHGTIDEVACGFLQ
jgi:hypothetical protein